MKFNVLLPSNKDGKPALADSSNSEPVTEEEASESTKKLQETLDGIASSLKNNRQVDVLKITRTTGAAALGWLSQGLILLFHHIYVGCINLQDERMLLHNNRWRLLWSVLAPLLAGSGWWWLVEQRARVQQGRGGDGRSHAPNVTSTACQTTGTFNGPPLKEEEEEEEEEGLGHPRNEGRRRGNGERNSSQASRDTALVAQNQTYVDELLSMKDKYEKQEKELQEAHALELGQSKKEIQSLKQTHTEQLQVREDLTRDLHRNFVRAATIINGKSLFLMARFRRVSKEQECALYHVDDKSGLIEAMENDGGGDQTTPGGRFRGLSGVITRSQDNKDVWRLLHPGFLAFTCGHPVCFLFDGYSGSGKSYTMFNGPESIVNSITTALFEWKERMDSLDRPITIGFEAVIVDPHPGSRSKTDFPPLGTLHELGEAIRSVRQTRDERNRPTNNNPSSSRSHLVMRFKATGKTPVKPWSSFCLVDLAGNERSENPKGGKTISQAEIDERNFINTTRSDLHAMLKDPHNLSYKGDLTRHLLDYIFIGRENEAEKKQRPVREPKVFILSCLSPTAASRQMTINTLRFTQELLDARGGND